LVSSNILDNLAFCILGATIMSLQGIINGLIPSLILKIFEVRKYIYIWIYTKIIKPNSEIRIVVSSLLRIYDKGSYILVRNSHRNETFSPFGGVMKYERTAQQFLDIIGFEQDAMCSHKDMEKDIRGFIPRKNLIKFITWYNSNNNRESRNDCAKRELREELQGAKVDVSSVDFLGLSLCQVRTIMEGPESVKGYNYKQFRIFEIVDLDTDYDSTKRLLRIINDELQNKNHDLLAVNSREIRKGRHLDGSLIGDISSYLIGSKKIGYATPPKAKI
jgi:SMODS-associated NUDIX domain